MPESGGLFIIDGEDAGSTPWEFDSLSEEGGNTIALDAAAKNNGDNGYKITFDGSGDFAYGIKGHVAQTELYVRLYIYIPSSLQFNSSFDVQSVLEMRDSVSVCKMGFRSGATQDPAQWSMSWRFTDTFSSTNFSMDTWHYIELRFLKDNVGTSGGAQMWVDGDLIATDLDQAADYDPDEMRIGAHFGSTNPDAGSF